MSQEPLTILLVDDDADVRAAVRRELSRVRAWKIVEAESPSEGLDHISRQRVDVLVTDYDMPGMTGLELLELARVTQPDMVRVLLTGHADLHLALHALNQGLAHRFVVKPWNDVDLRQVVCESLAAVRAARPARREL
jgi:FixJ family two-component response regulator